MKLNFVDRKDELARLRRSLKGGEPSLSIVYGRRRCGKSTLLQRAVRQKDVYFLADERESPLQIQSLSHALDRAIPAFGSAQYTSWDSLLRSLAPRIEQKINLVIDEFPYLVKSAPELPSLIQRVIDSPDGVPISWVLCGSSQRMMQGIVLDRKAPLYGRAREIIEVSPLRAGWILEALGMTAEEAIEAYSVWGGVPRYWELASEYETTEQAMTDLVLDRNGVLHDEPARLLRDDMRSSVQAQSLLSLIGFGCHRLSEIAGRLGKPAGSLSRPLANLVELGYVQKELPWGESARSTKKTLCRIRDPFIRFYFRFVVPAKSLLEIGKVDSVLKGVKSEFGMHCSSVWEDLARESVPFSEVAGKEWGIARRWWGHDERGRDVELDIVAESVDRKSLLIGEAKWAKAGTDYNEVLRKLKEKVKHLPFAKNRSVVFAIYVRRPSGKAPSNCCVLSPADVLSVLK